MVPDLPSLVAVITTVPGVTPVTRPVGDTVATAAALDDQVTTRSVTTVPFTSSTVALNWRVDLATIDDPCGRMLTDPTAKLEIVSAADPLFPSLVAVIVALPAATAVTTPCAETVATAVFELDHATAGPVTTLPEASFSVAASCVVCPTDIESGAGVIVTVATAACPTLTVATPVFPSDVAVIVAEPWPTAIIKPPASTVATLALLVLHAMARSLSGFCAASYAIAVNCA